MLETIGEIWRRVERERGACHDLGEETAGHGAEREAEVVMAEVEPQTVMARDFAGQARAAAEPGLGIDAGTGTH